MAHSTLPEGQSLYDFLHEGKQNGKDVYEHSMSQHAEDIHRTIGYPQGQLNKLEIGNKTTDLTSTITGTESVASTAAAVVLGQKNPTASKPDLVGPAKSTVVTAPPQMLAHNGGLPDLTPSAGSISNDIFKSHKGKA
ncbi:MAG: hypothetical protein ACKO0M_14305 [Cyanobium sp.]